MLRLRVENIRRDAPDTATFFLREVNGKKVQYEAGQFITLVFEHHRQEIRRSYSISSSPHEDLLAITVKRVTNGELSRFLLMHTQTGDIWNAVGPSGRFTINKRDHAHDIFFFAAGSGITPIFSQIKFLLARHRKSRLYLIYSNRNQSSVLFKDELADLQASHAGQLTIVDFLSDDGDRLNNLQVERLVQQFARARFRQSGFYLCGPFDYMRMVRLTLIFMGVPPGHIRKENFVLDTVPVEGARIGFEPHKFRVVFGGETYDIQAGENQSMLQAALQNNIPLPYSCRAGICSACAAKCTAGKVHITANEVLTDADLAAGWVLTCTGYAINDEVVIELPRQ